MSVNQLVISLSEKDMGMDIVTIRGQNKQSKENDEEQRLPMSELRQQARELIEQMPEEKLIYIIQIMQGINGLFGTTEMDNNCCDE